MIYTQLKLNLYSFSANINVIKILPICDKGHKIGGNKTRDRHELFQNCTNSYGI